MNTWEIRLVDDYMKRTIKGKYYKKKGGKQMDLITQPDKSKNE